MFSASTARQKKLGLDGEALAAEDGGVAEIARADDDAALAAELAPRLTRWFRRHHRDLAWRRTRDPYAIWVSEIMLQQTRVSTVESYYDRFLARFPDLGTLAAADEDDVLEAWSGLGYYRRARLLHRGARFVCEETGGKIPRDAASLRRIPGVGRYTAGAIAAIAFDSPEPLVDGNVARVLSRILAIDDPGEQGADAAVHWRVTRAILARGRPRILAQALMELGATVCTPRAPECARCPVRGQCQARAEGSVERIPAVRKRAPSPTSSLWALAVFHGERLLLVRRPRPGLLGGMWCLPLRPGGHARAPSARVAGEHLGFRVGRPETVAGERRHVFTHRVWQLRARRFAVDRRPKCADSPDHTWVAPGERPPGGLPKVTRKLLGLVGHGSA